jgi:hypothetical protein
VRRRLRTLVGSGRFWTGFWLLWIGVWLVAIWPSVTVWRNSLPYLVFLSVMALVLGCSAALQSSLTMRKADPDDPL